MAIATTSATTSATTMVTTMVTTIADLLSSVALPHALAGTVALVTFWMAGMARKGSPFHKGAGKVYMLAMIAVVLTAAPLALSLALEGHWVGATFLAYLVVLVSHSCRLAWMAVRRKRDFSSYIGTGFRISASLLALSGAAVAIVGFQYGAWLLIIFGMLGPIGGWDAWKLIREGPQSPKWWLKEHYGAMIGNGVATHIAFLQIGLMRMFPELGSTMIQHLAWFGPLAIGIAAGFWLKRRYMRPSPAAAPGA